MSERSPRARLGTVFAAAHPADAARVLVGHAPEDAAEALTRLPSEIAAGIFELMPSRAGARCLARLAPDAAVELVARGQPHAVAGALRTLPSARLEPILGALPAERRAALERLLAYRENTAAAWVDVAAPALEPNATADQALDALRSAPQAADTVCVVEADGHLRGAVSCVTLLRASATQPLRGLLQPDLAPIPAAVPITSVADHPGWAHVRTLPVADETGRFLGSLDFDVVRTQAQRPDEAAASLVYDTTVQLAAVYVTTLTGLIGLAQDFLQTGTDETRSHDG